VYLYRPLTNKNAHIKIIICSYNGSSTTNIVALEMTIVVAIDGREGDVGVHVVGIGLNLT